MGSAFFVAHTFPNLNPLHVSGVCNFVDIQIISTIVDSICTTNVEQT